MTKDYQSGIRDAAQIVADLRKQETLETPGSVHRNMALKLAEKEIFKKLESKRPVVAPPSV